MEPGSGGVGLSCHKESQVPTYLNLCQQQYGNYCCTVKQWFQFHIAKGNKGSNELIGLYSSSKPTW